MLGITDKEVRNKQKQETKSERVQKYIRMEKPGETLTTSFFHAHNVYLMMATLKPTIVYQLTMENSDKVQ